jgi:nucleotide-binding universal stress UspA family protein
VRDVTAVEHVVCGIDGSPEAIEAARQAARLVPRDGRILLVEVLPPDGSRPAADSDLAAARSAIDAGIGIGIAAPEGPAAEMLEHEAVHNRADTIAVGSHGRGRVAGVLLGSVATRLIHHASCSVLVARAAPAGPFPRRVVVGFDGSGAARHALDVGRRVAARAGVPVRVLHVLDGAIARGVLQSGGAEEVEEVTAAWSAADGLCARIAAGDLIVIGSRELRGIRSLGSVSEAVAHQAPASVLIVRGP